LYKQEHVDDVHMHMHAHTHKHFGNAHIHTHKHVYNLLNINNKTNYALFAMVIVVKWKEATRILKTF